MALSIGELVGYLLLDDSDFTRGMRNAEDRISSFTRGAGEVGKASAKAGAAIAAIGSGVQGLAGVAAIATTTAGALLVLPAAAGAAKFGMVALQVAMSGFGDAMSSMEDPAAFAAAIAELSPAAAAAATSVRDLKPAWDAMADSVQERMFAGLADDVTALGTTYMPILGDSFGRVADAANLTGQRISNMLQSSSRVKDVTTMTGDFASAWENLLPSLGPISAALLDIGVVGGGALRQLTDGAGGAAVGFQQFIAQARQSGQLALWMHEGINALKMLGEVAGNIGEILGGIFRAADTGGAGFLTRLVSITQQIADMVNSVAGQEAFGTFFATAAQLSGLFMEALTALLPVLPPLVDVLGALAVNVGTMLVGALTALAPYLEAFALWLQENPALVTGAALAIGALVIAANGLLGLIKVIGVVKTIWNSGLLQMAANAALAVGRILISLALWVAQTLAQGAIAVASMVATAARYVAAWVLMGVQAMARAVMMAAAWLVAMGPIGWVIAAVVGLVALIIANWDTVVAWTQQAWSAVTAAIGAAWEWIKNAVATAIDFLVGLFLNFTGPGLIIKHWDTIKAATAAAFDAVVAFIRSAIDQALAVLGWLGRLPGLFGDWFAGAYNAVRDWLGRALGVVAALPGQILSAVGNLGSLLFNAGRDVVIGLWNGIVGMGRWLYSKIMGWIRSVVPGPVLSFLGIASPSKFMKNEVGRWIPEGLADGILGNAKVAGDAARDMAMQAAEGARGAIGSDGASLELGGLRLDVPSLSSQRADGETASGGGGVTFNVYNPIAERSSATGARVMRTYADMGAYSI